MPAIRFSARGYVGSIFRDIRAALARVLHDRAALAVIALVLLPWASLFLLRSSMEWLWQLGGLIVVVFAFWWMSRSGSAPLPAVKQPRLEFLLAAALAVWWVVWRVGICGNGFFFLPLHFQCFKSLEFETVPKTIALVIFPAAILFAARYGWRAQGIDLNLRAWWIALPALLGVAAYAVYLHYNDLPKLAQNTVEYFFAAGLPEEFLFRAFLLTRLEAWLRNSAWALFGSSVLFGLTHLPMDYLYFTSRDWRETWITVLTFQMGFGVAFAFAYQRTRNIWPIAIIHALVDAL